MDKELEALKIGIPKLKKLYENSAKKMSQNDILGFDLVFVYLDKALQRLDEIDQTNPSEALEELEKVIEEITISNADLRKTLKTGILIATIKQALIKSQEQEKVLKIIFEKSLNIPIFKEFIRLNKPIDYMLKRFNQGREKKNQFTEEEFELLKRYLNE